MKKLFSVFMIFVLVLGLAACGSKNDGEGYSGKSRKAVDNAAGHDKL